MNMKRMIALAVVLITSHLVFFVLGEIHNRRAMFSTFAIQDRRTSGAVDLGLYLEYRDIALDILAKEDDKALCAAQLGASGRYDDLKACLASQDCRIAIEQRVRERAPEVLGEAPLKFTYIAAKDGIRSCERPPMRSPNTR